MNTVKIEQTKEGFKLNCSLNEIPLDIVEQIVRNWNLKTISFK